jgi:hypothetical protein
MEAGVPAANCILHLRHSGHPWPSQTQEQFFGRLLRC